MSQSKLVFNSQDDLARNAIAIATHNGWSELSAIGDILESFRVSSPTCDTGIVTIKEGKFMSALLLHYFWWTYTRVPSQHTISFSITPDMVQDTRAYFGATMCAEAEANPDTPHTTVRAILQPDARIFLFPHKY